MIPQPPLYSLEVAGMEPKDTVHAGQMVSH